MFTAFATPLPQASFYKISMSNSTPLNTSRYWLLAFFALVLTASFFLPWVAWQGTPVAGYDMPAGRFFAISDTQFGLANPFPQTQYLLYGLWLIPGLGLLTAILALTGNRAGLAACIAGTLSLAALVMFILFSGVLVDLGVGDGVKGMLRPWIYVQAISAAGIILAPGSGKAGLKKLLWILAGPLFAFASFMIIKNYLEKQTFGNTSNSKADYTISANELIHEFVNNDSAANNKYTEKTVIVNGQVSEVEAADTTINLKFTDSTSGSYAIFAFQDQDVAAAKKVAAGDSVSIKGICSGGVYSRLRKATFISFKRSTLNK